MRADRGPPLPPVDLVLQEVLSAPDRALTQQPGYMQRLGAFTGASRVKRLALKLMVAAAVTTPGVLQSSELQRLRVRPLGLARGQFLGGLALLCCWTLASAMGLRALGA